MAAIVVPFRGAGGKRRLGPLTDDEREALALAMLDDVLAACRSVGETVVVTRDDEAARLADEHDARVVDDPGSGQGSAVAAALRGVAGPVLVVNADVPCVLPDDLRRLEAATPVRGFALVAARDGTTNALGLSEPTLFAPLYGPGSAERFRLHGVRLGVDIVRAEIPNLEEDVDSIDDLRRLERRVGPRTLSAAVR
jgi:2-phospho-L-lactate/phosphoenolpyruvate guanylyltransferase